MYAVRYVKLRVIGYKMDKMHRMKCNDQCYFGICVTGGDAFSGEYDFTFVNILPLVSRSGWCNVVGKVHRRCWGA